MANLRSEIAQYIMAPTRKQQLEGELTKAEQLIAGITTLDKAKQAKKMVSTFTQQWKELARTGGHEKAQLTGHTDVVNAIPFSPDGQTLASAGNDSTVRLWNVSTKQQQLLLKHNCSYVFAVAFSPDGRMLASAGNNKKVWLWDAANGGEQAALQHPNWVRAIAFSPNGKMLASACDDHIVRLWDIASGRSGSEFKGHTGPVNAIVFSPSSPDGKILATGGADKTVRLWEWGHERTFKGHTKEVVAVAFSPDGILLATSSDDKTVRLWDVATGQCQKVLTVSNETTPLPPPPPPPPYRPPRQPIAFSPDGTLLASGSNDGMVWLWDVASGQLRLGFRHSDGVTAIAARKELLAYAPADKTVRLRDYVVRKP
jgi:WD40 repeat protein